jgi:hypothetical protein
MHVPLLMHGHPTSIIEELRKTTIWKIVWPNLTINKEFFSNEPPLIHGEHFVKEEVNIVIVIYVRLVQIIWF